ncbi:DUF6932 family protein [Hoeflea algicola]|uniref:DUF6932 family protein n=1 Tax=Hoeflea algicola TaxID=2983763 RepID=UPI003CE5849B
MEGNLPPIWPEEDGTSNNRSPYPARIIEIVDQFATSIERRNILEGLLRFRQELYGAGVLHGFQWLDGSFMEDVETHQSRSPNDIDVITYFHLPEGETQATLYEKIPHIFNNDEVRARFRVDSYFEILGEALVERRVRQVSY